MKKIILAFEASNFHEGAFEFARRLNELEPIQLTGAFLPQMNFSSAWSYATGNGPEYIPLVEPSVSVKVAGNIQRFQSLCREHHISFDIHKHFNELAGPELRKEARFADLLIMGNDVQNRNMDFLEDMLHDSECPVLIVPLHANFPRHIVLAYDGSADAAYAIKSFSCVLGGMCGLPTSLIYAGKGTEHSIPDLDYVEELATCHFSNLNTQQLGTGHGLGFSDWLTKIQDPLLVTGSYSRSFFSQMLRESFSERQVEEHKIPIFVAHK